MKYRSVILLITGAFFLTLTVRFPAELVLANVDIAPLVIQNPGGTVWRGAARSISLGSNRLQDVRWSLDFRSLLRGQIGADINFTLLGGIGQTKVARTFDGDVFVSDGKLQITALGLDSLLSASPLQLGGEMQLLVETAHLTRQLPQSVRASLSWRNATIKSPLLADLGTVKLTLIPAPEGHTAQLENAGGVVRVSGKFEIDKRGGYRADIRLKPLANAPAELLSMLELLGRKGSDGAFRLRHSGRLGDFF